MAGPPRGQLKAIDHDCNDIPDAAMTLAVAALYANGSTAIRNVYNWRVKETERMVAIVTELGKLGAQVSGRQRPSAWSQAQCIVWREAQTPPLSPCPQGLSSQPQANLLVCSTLLPAPAIHIWNVGRSQLGAANPQCELVDCRSEMCDRCGARWRRAGTTA